VIDEILKIADSVARNILSENFNIEVKGTEESIPELDEFWYSGIVGVLGTIGDLKGRVIIGIDFNLCTHLVRMIYNEDVVTNNDMLEVSYEMFNMIVGNTLVECKNTFSTALRPTPPSIFLGENMLVVSPKIQRKKIEYIFELGKMFIEVGFERGM